MGFGKPGGYKGGFDEEDQPKSNAEFYIFNTLFKLRDAEAEKRYSEAFVFLRHNLQMLLSYLSIEERKKVDIGIRQYYAQLENIKKTQEAEASQKKYIEDLNRTFIEQHMYYVYIALPRARMIKIDAEGEMPIDKLDLDTISKIISSANSPETSLRRVIGKENEAGQSV